jgi:hypothetical protein
VRHFEILDRGTQFAKPVTVLNRRRVHEELAKHSFTLGKVRVNRNDNHAGSARAPLRSDPSGPVGLVSVKVQHNSRGTVGRSVGLCHDPSGSRTLFSPPGQWAVQIGW